MIIGNWLEFYDFLVFAFFAVMIGDAFFPGDSDIGRLLGALATFVWLPQFPLRGFAILAVNLLLICALTVHGGDLVDET